MVHGVSIDAQGRVYATDSDNQRVVVFDAQGKFIKNIAMPGRGGSFMAADGTFYISDVNSGAVAVLKNDQIDRRDQGRGPAARPRRRSDDRRRLHVIDSGHTAGRDEGDAAARGRRGQLARRG